MGRSTSKLYRSSENRFLGGVCGGIADYFDIDVTLVRLAWVFFTLIGGAGIIAYILALIIVPEEPHDGQPREKKKPATDVSKLLGSALILIGIAFLFRQLGFHHWLVYVPWHTMLALLLVGTGVFMLLHTPKSSTKGQTSQEKPGDQKQFYRIDEGKMLAGVCTGIAAYFNIDVTLARLLWIFATLSSVGLGLLAYIIAIIVFPTVSNAAHLQAGKEQS